MVQLHVIRKHDRMRVHTNTHTHREAGLGLGYRSTPIVWSSKITNVPICGRYIDQLACAAPRVYNRKSVQLPFGFYTRFHTGF